MYNISHAQSTISAGTTLMFLQQSPAPAKLVLVPPVRLGQHSLEMIRGVFKCVNQSLAFPIALHVNFLN